MNLDFIDAVKKKQPKTRYVKPKSLKQLEELCFKAKQARYPNNPAVIKPSYRDDTANELTRSIIAWMKLNGHFSARVNVTGIYDSKLGRYRRSGGRKGLADIQSVINGGHVSIEIKIGRDKLRPDQLKVKDEIERAGGIYITVSSFDDFLEKIKQIQK